MVRYADPDAYLSVAPLEGQTSTSLIEGILRQHPGDRWTKWLSSRDGMKPCELFDDVKAAIFLGVCALGLKRIILTRKASRYRTGGSGDWRKSGVLAIWQRQRAIQFVLIHQEQDGGVVATELHNRRTA
jgi:hypothetical protein